MEVKDNFTWEVKKHVGTGDYVIDFTIKKVNTQANGEYMCIVNFATEWHGLERVLTTVGDQTPATLSSLLNACYDALELIEVKEYLTIGPLIFAVGKIFNALSSDTIRYFEQYW